MISFIQFCEMMTHNTKGSWFFIERKFWNLFTKEERVLCKVDPNMPDGDGDHILRIFYPSSSWNENYIDCHNIRNFRWDDSIDRLVNKKTNKPVIILSDEQLRESRTKEMYEIESAIVNALNDDDIQQVIKLDKRLQTIKRKLK